MIDYGTNIRRAWLFGTDGDEATELDSRRADAIAWLRSRGWYRGDARCVHVYRDSGGALTSPYPDHRQAPLFASTEPAPNPDALVDRYLERRNFGSSI